MGDKNPRQREKLQKQRRRAAEVASSDGMKRAVASPSAPSDTMDRPLRFRFDRVDLGSEWCLTYIGPEDHGSLIAFMAEMESKPLKEVVPAHCKRENVAEDSQNGQAKKRAREQFPDDHDHIHVLRINGAQRLWGLLYDHEFSIIWWDPTHAVFPTKRVYGN